MLWGVVRRREIERGQRAGCQGRNWGHFGGRDIPARKPINLNGQVCLVTGREERPRRAGQCRRYCTWYLSPGDRTLPPFYGRMKTHLFLIRQGFQEFCLMVA